jgi:uncharacterized repeat protein (TIGR01451 family)
VKHERGQALPLALIALALVALTSAPLLSQVSTGLMATRVGEGLVVERYSADAGVEHALWRLVYEVGFAESLTAQNPTAEYSIEANGGTVNIRVTKLGATSPTGAPVGVSKAVFPDSAPGGQETTFTYTIYIENLSLGQQDIHSIGDLLPLGFSYVAGSSSGVTTDDPQIQIHDGSEQLRWKLDPFVPISSGEVREQVFQATATLEGGIYLNEAWVKVTGYAKVYSGATAPVVGPSIWNGLSIEKVVSPSSARIGQETTFTYTIYIENVDTAPIEFYKIEDQLPAGFSYLTGSSSGITTADPQIAGGDRLTWTLSPSILISPGEAREQVFQAVATLDEGTYWNEAWVYFLLEEEEQIAATSPTAPVEAYYQYDIQATAGGTTIRTAAIVSQGAVTVLSWQIE